MRKIVLSSLGLLGLAATALPAPGGAEARTLAADPSVVQTASAAAVEQGIAAADESAASRRRGRRSRRGGGGNGGRQ